MIMAEGSHKRAGIQTGRIGMIQSKGVCSRCEKLSKSGMSRRLPPSGKSPPPASVAEGAAHVRQFIVKLCDKQDGQGVNWRMITDTLFRAAFNVLDELPDHQKTAVARLVHEESYRQMTEDSGEAAGAGKSETAGSVPAPSNTAVFKSTAPRPPRVGH